MRPKTALLTILLAMVLATTVIGVGSRITTAEAASEPPAMRSI